MKALILSVKAGYGHHSTGMAIMDCLKENNIECEMLDTLEYINPILGGSVDDGYLLLTKYLKEAYGKVYSQLDKNEYPKGDYSFSTLVSKILSIKLEKYVTDYNPDIIIGTHSYAALLMTIMKKRNTVNCPSFGIVTDFTIHPFWESTELDYYVIPDAMLSASAERKCIPNSKILPYGIPIRKQFSVINEKSEVRRKLGLDDKETVLVMMGSMGFGKITDIIEEIDTYNRDFQVVVVCGNNEKSKSSIEEITWNKNVVALGFTNNVHEYMDASDLIITKPGGLTTSEAMAKKLPLILMNPIPGQEERNQEFLVNAGVAMSVSKTFTLTNAMSQFFDCKWRRELLIRAVEYMGKPYAAQMLYEHIVKVVNNTENEPKEEICLN